MPSCIGSAGGGSVSDPNVTSLPQQRLENMEEKGQLYSLEPKMFSEQPSEQEIINRLAGGDQTKGSCASLALAYAANKAGIDVLDFRDGESRKEFSENFWHDIGSSKYGINDGFATVQQSKTPKRAIKETMNNFAIGKEYILVAGKHAAVVKKTADNKFKYLELQSRNNNGWQDYTFGYNGTLETRFGYSSRKRGHKTFMTIDIKAMGESQGFKNLLKYINTPADKQNKGSKGNRK